MPKEHSVESRLKKGILALSFRSLLVHGLQVVSLLVLARWLVPDDYGTFGILNSWVGVALYFSDIGTLGALTQMREEPSRDQVRASSSLQLGSGLFFCLTFWIFAPALTQYQHLGAGAIPMIRILALSIPAYTMRASPLLMLNRKLKFNRIAYVDFSETFVGYAVQISMAMVHQGAWCFIGATLARNLFGTLMLYWIQHREKETLTFPMLDPLKVCREIKPLLKFGIPFQANAVLPALRGLIVPLILAPLLPLNEVGILVWTVGLASIPIALSINFNQVVFPALSRLQGDSIAFRRVTIHSTKIALVIFAFMFGLGASLSSSLVNLIFSAKWADSKPIFPLACLAIALSTVRYLSASFLNAAGRARSRMWIELFALLFEVSLIWYGVRAHGLSGYLWALVISNLLALAISAYFVKDFLNFSVLKRFMLVSLLAGIPCHFLFLFQLQNNLLISLCSFLIIFCGGLYLSDSSLSEDLAYIKDSST